MVTVFVGSREELDPTYHPTGWPSCPVIAVEQPAEAFTRLAARRNALGLVDQTTADLCTAFEVGESTVHAKARVIEETLGTRPLDPRWTLPSFADKNPLVWMAEVNGLLVDLRHMPRDVQEIAFAKGLIPYIPADRKDRS
jgi:hypothetical protein